jgi:hypothetical protein
MPYYIEEGKHAATVRGHEERRRDCGWDFRVGVDEVPVSLQERGAPRYLQSATVPVYTNSFTPAPISNAESFKYSYFNSHEMKSLFHILK